MKPSITFISTLVVLGLPITAQAACDFYMNSRHGLTLPATVIVPDSLPVGGEIIRQAFSGREPDRFMTCHTATLVNIYGRYHGRGHPPTASYRTEVPGVGIKIRIRDARGITNYFGLQSGESVQYAGRHPTLTNAEAIFIKTGPVTDGTVPPATIFSWTANPGGGPVGGFYLIQNNAVRFVKPAGTCNLAAGDVNRTITLPAIKVSQLTGEVGVQPFDLTAVCEPDVHTVSFRFTGTASTGNPALFANTGTSTGAGLSLSHRNVAYIPANGTPEQRTRQVTTSAGRAVLPMNAAYSTTGAPVNAGTLVSTVTVSITYE